MGGINFDFAVPNSRTELETGLGLITQDVYKIVRNANIRAIQRTFAQRRKFSKDSKVFKFICQSMYGYLVASQNRATAVNQSVILQLPDLGGTIACPQGITATKDISRTLTKIYKHPNFKHGHLQRAIIIRLSTKPTPLKD